MSNTNVSVFIMAGGSGTRLAPLSLNMPGKLPKQFLSLVGDKTLLQNAINRVPNEADVTIIPEVTHEKEVLSQGRNMGRKISSLSEPFGCNTAAAILLGALSTLKKYDENRVLFFMPADHIMDDNTFRNIFNTAVEVASSEEKIVTIGITPTRAETGYGYINVKKDDNSDSKFKKVNQFVEKPDLKTAEKYLASGDYYWNAGIFAFKVKTIIEAMKKNSPIIFEELDKIKDDLNIDNISQAYTAIKEKKENISIDFAVMEKESKNILLIPAPTELKWNDVGGWVALEEYLDKDSQGNYYSKKQEITNSNNNLVLTYNNIKIKLDGSNELLIVSTDNGILLTKKETAPRAKEIIPGIQAGKSHEEIDCKNVSVKVTNSKTYLGVVAIENLNIEFDGKQLNINQK
jgi:mannose-1-phosphate guanylyltransferase/mannose-6-phosphate isomerase